MRKRAARIAGALAAVMIVGVMFIRTTYFPKSAENAGNEAATEVAVEEVVFPYLPLPEFSGSVEYPEIVTDNFRAGFSTDGGILRSLDIISGEGDINLFSDAASGRIFAGGNAEGPLSGIYQYSTPDKNTIVFSCSYADDKTGFSVKKTYKFDPETYIYALSIKYEGDTSGIPGYSIQLPGAGKKFVAHTRKGKTYPSYDGDVIRAPSSTTWAGTEDSDYAFILLNPKELEGQLEYRRDEGLLFSEPEESFSAEGQELQFFAGPKSGLLLAKYDGEYPGISTLAYPTGFIKPLVKFFSALLRQLKLRLLPDYGLVIVLLALLVKITFISVSGKSIASSEAVKRLQPEIRAIRNNGNLDPFSRKENISAIYKENGVKPWFGVLNLLIHLLVFISISRIFTNLYDFRDASSQVLSLSRLSKPDTLFSIGSFSIRLLPILVLIPTFIQSRILQVPDPGDRAQTVMSWVIPFLIFALFYQMPSAAVLYWLSQTVFSLVEILIFRKRRKES